MACGTSPEASQAHGDGDVHSSEIETRSLIPEIAEVPPTVPAPPVYNNLQAKVLVSTS